MLKHGFGVDWRGAKIFSAPKGFLKNVADANTPLEHEIQDRSASGSGVQTGHMNQSLRCVIFPGPW